MVKVDWLDRLTFREIEMINEVRPRLRRPAAARRVSRANVPASPFFFPLSNLSPQSEKRSSNFMYLMVEFPRVKANDREYSIVYYEKVCSRGGAEGMGGR